MTKSKTNFLIITIFAASLFMLASVLNLLGSSNTEANIKSYVEFTQGGH